MRIKMIKLAIFLFQVYQNVIRSMTIYDEKRYPSACVEPPVPKCYLSQLDAQNDVLVLENLGFGGYRRYDKGDHIVDLDHCRVVLRRIAHFHAISTLIQRDSEQWLFDLFPFAIEASGFQQRFRAQVARVKEEVEKFIRTSNTMRPMMTRRCDGSSSAEAANLSGEIENHLQDLFWKLVELRALPRDRRFCVLVHGALDPCNILFQYDDVSGRPICAKFLDFSTLTVSSPVIDISYFLNRSVHPELARANHAVLLQHYHRSHTEAIKSFGMHGYEIEMEVLLDEYQSKQDYGAMMGCFLRPAIYVLQRFSDAKTHSSAGGKSSSSRNGNRNGSSAAPANRDESNGEAETATTDKKDGNCDIDDDDVPGAAVGAEEKASEGDGDPIRFKPTVPVDRLRIDRGLLPTDHRLHGHLSSLSKSCPCPCSMQGSGGGREMNIADLSADSLEDLRIEAQKQNYQGLRTFDCGNGSTTNTLKKLFLGFMNNDDHSAGSKSTQNKASSNGEAAAVAATSSSSKAK